MSTNEQTPGGNAPGRLFHLRRAFDRYPLPTPGAYAAGNGWLHPETRLWLDAHAKAGWHKGDAHVVHVMSAIVSGLSAHLDVAPPGASVPLPSTLPGQVRLLVSMGGERYVVEVTAAGPGRRTEPVLEPEAKGEPVFDLYPFPQAVMEAYDRPQREPVPAQPVVMPDPPSEWLAAKPVPAQRWAWRDSVLVQVLWRIAIAAAGATLLARIFR